MIRGGMLLVLAAAAAQAHALEATDDRSVTVSLARPAERIVALAPHLAEIAYAAGAGEKLVGVSAYSRHPAEVERLPVVASAGRVDMERLIALRPDLVLAWQSGNSPLQIDRLERLGMRVFVTEVRSLGDIARIVRAVGALGGTPDPADASARDFERKIGRLRDRYTGRERISVFVEIWHRPMLTVSGAHLISNALDTCGGSNVFAAARGPTSLVSREQLLDARPEAIITAGSGAEAPRAWRGLETVPAVRHRRIYTIDPDLLYGQGPSLLEGVRVLCDRLDVARN